MIEQHEVGTPRLRPLMQKPITDKTIECIAVVCHEANRGYCETQGDTSQLGWNDAPQWQRDSARLGVKGILEGRITKPSESHESWLAEKVADGWTYGEVKDPSTKQHPCMVPYDELPGTQRVKDHIFFGVVKSMAAFHDAEVES